MEEKKYCGEFWIGDKKENKIIGYIEKGILTLSKSFLKKGISGIINGKAYIPKEEEFIINGHLVSGDKVCLYGIFSIDKLQEKEYLFSYLIFGANYNSEKDITFKYFNFSFDGIFEFIGKGMIEGEKINKSGGNPYFGFDEMNIKIHKTGKPIFEGKIDDLDVSIINGLSYIEPNHNFQNKETPLTIFNGIKIENKPIFRIESKNNTLTIEKIEDFLLNIQRLFSIILMKDVKLNDIEINDEYFWSEREKKILETKKDSIIKKIEIIFQRGFLANNNSKEEIKGRNNLLFSYKDVDSVFGEILKTWFENTQKFKTIYNLYYATLQNEELHLENQFLNLIQAIEGMFWKVAIEVEIKSKKYIVNNSLSKTKKDEVDKQYNLINKLELIEKYLGIKFKISGEDLKEKIKDIRNCFSHGGDRDDYFNGDKGNIDDLFNIICLLKIVLEIFIIKELGLEDDLYNSIRDYKININLKSNIIDNN